MSHVVMADRPAFMQQAYNALYSGAVLDLPAEVQRTVVAEVTRDLVGVIRFLTQEPVDLSERRGIVELREAILNATRPN